MFYYITKHLEVRKKFSAYASYFQLFFRCLEMWSNTVFTITAEILARSLANFYCQYADRHMNLKFMRRVSERERAIRPFVIVKKQIDVSFSSVCSVIDNEFRYNIVKVVYGSTFGNEPREHEDIYFYSVDILLSPPRPDHFVPRILQFRALLGSLRLPNVFSVFNGNLLACRRQSKPPVYTGDCVTRPAATRARNLFAGKYFQKQLVWKFGQNLLQKYAA